MTIRRAKGAIPCEGTALTNFDDQNVPMKCYQPLIILYGFRVTFDLNVEYKGLIHSPRENLRHFIHSFLLQLPMLIY